MSHTAQEAENAYANQDYSKVAELLSVVIEVGSDF